MNDSQQPSPASVDLYARQVPSPDATATVRSISYPRYVPILSIAGFAMSVSGFVLSLALSAIWPMVILVFGLTILGLGSLGARRAERQSRHHPNFEIWSELNWTTTPSQGLPQQAGHMSATA